MKSKMSIALIVTLLLLAASAWAEDAAHQQIRKKAQKAYTNGNWKDAFELYHKLSLEIENAPTWAGNDFTQAWQPAPCH